MSATMVGWQQKIFKKHWLKRPKAVPPKLKSGPKYKWFKMSYLNPFSENIILGIQHFYICPDVPMYITRIFFNFRFSSRKSQSQQKLAKKIYILQYSFTQKTSLILQNSTHLTPKITCSQTQQKTFLTLQIL